MRVSDANSKYLVYDNEEEANEEAKEYDPEYIAKFEMNGYSYWILV